MTKLGLTQAPSKQNSTGRGKVKLGILLTYMGTCVRKTCRGATALIVLVDHEVISWTHYFFFNCLLCVLLHWGTPCLGSVLGGVIWIFLPEAHGSLGVLPWLSCCNLLETFTVDMKVLQGAMGHLLGSDVVFYPCCVASMCFPLIDCIYHHS